jgi:hypothetical protein
MGHCRLVRRDSPEFAYREHSTRAVPKPSSMQPRTGSRRSSTDPSVGETADLVQSRIGRIPGNPMASDVGRDHFVFRFVFTDPLQGVEMRSSVTSSFANAMSAAAALALVAFASVEVAIASSLKPQPPPHEYATKGSGPLCFNKLDYSDPMLPYKDVTSASVVPFSLMDDLSPLSDYLADELRRGGFNVTPEGRDCSKEILRIACHVKKRTAHLGISWFPFGDKWTITWGLSCTFAGKGREAVSKYYETSGRHAYWFLASSGREQLAAARATEEVFSKIAPSLVGDAISLFSSSDSR